MKQSQKSKKITIKKTKKSLDKVFYFFDPTSIKTFSDLISNLSKKTAPAIRKKGFENYLLRNGHQAFSYKNGDVYVMNGAKYNDTEFHIAEKLTTAGYHVMFPNSGDLGRGRKNDVYIYDTTTYFPYKAELKSLFGDSAQTVRGRIISGGGQAPIIVYDVQSGIKRNWLIEGLRMGWSSNLRCILLNWKGQWYEINKDNVFKKNWFENNLK